MEIPCEFIFDNFTYKCIINNFDFTSKAKIKSFDGDHRSSLSNNNVSVISFESCIMPDFPRDLTKFFPNLSVIQICSCGLKKITKEDLQGYPDLVYIGIIDNEISSLPGNLFEANPKVEFMDFSMNRISSISPMIFAPLTKVYGVSLRHNKSIDAHYVTDDLESSVGSLEELMENIKINCRPLEDLKSLAAAKLSENISKENAAKIFFYGNRFEITAMKRKAFLYLKKNVLPWIDESFYRDANKLVKLVVEDVKK